MARNRRPRRSTKGKKSEVAFTKAPLQGMGETYTWNTNDVQPVTFPSSVGNNSYSLRCSADVNGYAWNIGVNGSNVTTSATTSGLPLALYGETNSQFQRIAQLWQEYRVDRIGYEFQPTGPGGSVNMTSSVTVMDESAALQGTPAVSDLVEKLSAYKTVKLHTPYSPLKAHLNLKQWLGQTQERAWLQTQEPGTAQIVREVYPTSLTDPQTPALSRTPALCCVSAFNFNGNTFFTGGVVVGVVIFKCKFTFRQRRAVTSDPFLDQTLLYEKDGLKYAKRLTPDEIKKLFEGDDVQEDKPSSNFAVKEMTESVLVQNMMTLFNAQKAPSPKDLTKEGIEPNPGPVHARQCEFEDCMFAPDDDEA